MSLIAQGVALEQGGVCRLRGVSCDIHPGELTVLVGPNGSGKTSLIKLLSGEIQATQGSVSLDGKMVHDWSALSLAQRRAVLPQHAALDFPFQVRDVVALGRSPHLSDRQRDQESVNEAMRAFDISQYAARLYTTLSGGERQRVHLARVWVQLAETNPEQPGYLLLDEPGSALDLRHIHELMQLLTQATRQRRLAVVAALHDLNTAARYADQLILLKQGEMLASGPVEQVMTVEHIQRCYELEVEFLDYQPNGRQVIAMPSNAMRMDGFEDHDGHKN